MPSTLKKKSKTDWRVQVGQLLVAVLIACVLGGIASKYIIYKNPAVTVTASAKVEEKKVVKKNVITKTTTTTPTVNGPIVTVIEEKDLTVEDTALLSSLLSSSLSTPVFNPSYILGIHGYRNVINNDWMVGATFKPLSFIEFGMLLNDREAWIGLGVPIK